LSVKPTILASSYLIRENARMTMADVDELQKFFVAAAESAERAAETSRSRFVDVNLIAFRDNAGLFLEKARSMIMPESGN
jgi:hypothetical protein